MRQTRERALDLHVVLRVFDLGGAFRAFLAGAGLVAWSVALGQAGSWGQEAAMGILA